MGTLLGEWQYEVWLTHTQCSQLRDTTELSKGGEGEKQQRTISYLLVDRCSGMRLSILKWTNLSTGFIYYFENQSPNYKEEHNDDIMRAYGISMAS